MKTEEVKDSLIPDQYQGESMDILEKRNFESIKEAAQAFGRACDRLLNVNNWGRLAGFSSFQLIDRRGIRVERNVTRGDYIRIDIPGPGTMAGMGYDWVKVEEITSVEDDETKVLAMTVRPTAHPVSGSPETAHFLRDCATSTFIIRLEGCEVSAAEHARNELANTAAERLFDKGRNFAVGIAAKIGFSYPQWKGLVKAFLAD